MADKRPKKDGATINIGLELRAGKDEAALIVLHFCAKRDNVWVYSINAINVVHEYAVRFPAVWQRRRLGAPES